MSNENTENEGGVFRNNSGNIRTPWVFILFIVCFFLVFAPTRMIFSNVSGGPLSEAHLGIQAIVAVIEMLIITILVYLFITKLDKRDFSWKGIGLEGNLKALIFLVLGIVLGLLIFYVALGMGMLQGTIEISNQQIELSSIIFILIWAMMNGFWHELAFRSYLQTRFEENNGVYFGIIGTALIYSILQQLDGLMTPLGFIAFLLLTILSGVLYKKTKSLYLVGAMQGMILFLPTILFPSTGEESILMHFTLSLPTIIVTGIALVILILYIKLKEE